MRRLEETIRAFGVSLFAMNSLPVWSKGDRDTVTAALTRAVAKFPERILFDFTGEMYTFAEVDALSNRLARGLLDLGVSKGDRVASILDNNLEAALTWLAINKIGAISVPINTALKGVFLQHQINDCGAKVVFAEADYAQRLCEVSDATPDVAQLIVRRPVDGTANRIPSIGFEQVLHKSAASVPDPNDPSDLAMLIYTAGTTGPSKGCMISHNYVCNLARQAVAADRRTSDDINWTALPLFHMNATGGSILASILVGSRVTIYPRFSVSKFWPEIRRSGATIASLLGSMIAFLAEAEDSADARACYGQLRIVRGSPFPGALQEKWKKRFGVSRAGSNAYGLTEAARVTSLPFDEVGPPGSSGRVNSDFDVRIVDEQDNEVPAGEAGEIIIRPRHPNIMFEGYWNRPEETLAIFRNLWLHSGDIGKFDENGFFYFVDRKKDYLRRRGENISSFEVETAFRAHPDVKDVAVHAVASEAAEDDVKATLVLKVGSELSEEELCRWAIANLPYYAVPRYIEFREDLPRNPVGRVLKFTLREEGCTPNTWDREQSDIVLQKR